MIDSEAVAWLEQSRRESRGSQRVEAMVTRPILFSARDSLLMIVAWILLYAEPIRVGPVSISQLWKLGVIVGLFMLCQKRYQPAWYLIAILFVFKALLYTSFPYGLLTNLEYAIEFFLFPTLLLWILMNSKNREDWKDRLATMSLKIALFLVFSTIPFILGLNSLHPVRDLSMWGSDSRAITGFFYHISPASKIFFSATLYILAAYPLFRKTFVSQVIFWAAAMIGSYLVYSSFTRTGWFIYVVGVVLIAVFQRGITYRFFAISILVVVAVVLGYYLIDNEAFLLRMAGGATYRQDVEIGLEAILSARLPFIFIAIENLNTGGFFTWVFGYGRQTGIDLFGMKTGMFITSHNGIMNMIETTGLLGLTIYVTFLFTIGRSLLVAMRYDPAMRTIYIITGYLWLVTLIISHGLPFYGQIVLLGPVARALLIRVQVKKRADRDYGKVTQK